MAELKARIVGLYFIATNGGVAFGGGERCLNPQFINKFRKLCCDKRHIEDIALSNDE